MNIRTFQRGDEAAQVAIYNEAVGALPKFKLAAVPEVQRRVQADDFDPSMRFYAVEDGQPVAYAVFNPNGRVSYPWCRKGHEAVAEPLFQQVLEAMRQRGHRKAFAAYRGDWPLVLEFFKQHGFTVAREMVNFVVDVMDLPTAPARQSSNITPLQRSDVPAVFALAPNMLRSRSAAELDRHLFGNPYILPSAAFALRNRDGSPTAVGLLIRNGTYADPKMVDSAMPCFRLGAFGTEGMTTKRIKGLFSFLCPNDGQCGSLAVELLTYAATLLRDDEDISAFAGQVGSDASHWLRFYQSVFRRQGSFPVLEREL